ncbi:CoA ester lyase [Comamonadaceae bacterium G21597-S1]|nr:CoA ester lyase [Comamonadaceae bacterium G21597-S1]
MSVHHAVRGAHTFLFVPANRPDRIPKAFASGADVVLIDLEDAVAESEKDSARTELARAWTRLVEAQRQRIFVRINASGSQWYQADVALMASLAAQSLAGVMLSKCAGREQVDELARALPAGGIIPLIESAEGLHAVDAIARGERVVRLAFGNLDFQADIGMCASQDEHELLPARLAIVLASRRAGLEAPIDGVSPALDDAQRLAYDAERGRRIGFHAKLCIHPKQVETVSRGLRGSPDELAWARRVLLSSQEHGLGAFSLDGRMVDAPLLQVARNLLGLESDSASTRR